MKTRRWLIVTAALLGMSSSVLIADEAPKKEDSNAAPVDAKTGGVETACPGGLTLPSGHYLQHRVAAPVPQDSAQKDIDELLTIINETKNLGTFRVARHALKAVVGATNSVAPTIKNEDFKTVLALHVLADDEKPQKARLSAEEIKDGWILLFDGETTAGWRSPNDSGWNVARGMLAPRADKPGLLVSTRKFGACELKLQYAVQSPNPLKFPEFDDPRRPKIELGCGADGQRVPSKGWHIHLPPRLPVFLGELQGEPTPSLTGWVDLSVTLTEDGPDQVANWTFQGAGINGTGYERIENHTVDGHIALCGNGVVFRNIKLRPIPDEAKGKSPGVESLTAASPATEKRSLPASPAAVPGKTETKTTAELKWARRVVTDFLSRATDHYCRRSEAFGFLSPELARAILKAQESPDHPCFLDSIPSTCRAKIMSEEVSPDESEVIYSGLLRGNAECPDTDFILRVAKESERGKWAIRCMKLEDREMANPYKVHLVKLLDKKVTLIGIANNAKAGATVQAGVAVVYVQGLDSWPEKLRGKKVRLSGTLVEKKFIPDPAVTGRAVSQGAAGMQLVIEHVGWPEECPEDGKSAAE